MRAGLAIRRMEMGDAAAVATLCGQLGYERPVEAVRTWIAGLGARAEGQAAFTASLDDEVVGWIEISLVSDLQLPAFALIGGLVVKDGVRGAGVGRELCRAAETWSWSRGVETVRVTSRSTREGAHRFYLRDGYRQVKMSMVFEKPRSCEAGD